MTAMQLGAIIATARPAHWAKNSFVLAPLVFARSLDDPEAIWKALAAAALFSAVASGVYFLNDACDARRDREHPAKRSRPVAMGTIGRVPAGAGGIAVMIAATALAWLLSLELAVVLSFYAGLNIVYSFYLKRFALLDIMVISSGFVLRAVAGALAIEVTISVWLLVCTFFVALLMAAGKRRVELATVGADSTATRPSLDQASVGFFDAVMAGAAGATMVFYTLYTVAPGTAEKFGGRGLILTMPFVVYGVWRYVQMIHSDNAVENPATALLRNRGMQASVLGWGVVVLAIIYGFGGDLGGFIE